MYSGNHGSAQGEQDPPGGFSAPSNNNTNSTTDDANINDDDDDADADEELIEPEFRSVAVGPHLEFALAQSAANRLNDPLNKSLFGGGRPIHNNNKSKDYYFNNNGNGNNNKATNNQRMNDAADAIVSNSELRQWKAHANDKIYVLPLYYPKCTKRSAVLEDESVENLLDRLSVCFQKLNVQAHFDQDLATFGLVLRTVEQLELSLLIWYADKSRSKLYVELDKRQCGSATGGGGAFPFQYICRILKCMTKPNQDSSSVCMPSHLAKMPGSGSTFMSQDTCARQMELLVGSSTEESSKMMMSDNTEEKSEQPLSCLAMIGTLLKTSMSWCKALELLSIVSDSNKTDLATARKVSKAILLPQQQGSYQQDIHEGLTNMLQSLAGNTRVDGMEHLSNYQKDCLLQMVLTCLVNAMEVQVQVGASSSSVLSQFVSQSNHILETLTAIMRHANTKPHHAYLAVKALFLLSSDASIRNRVSVAMMMQEGAAAESAVGSAKKDTKRCAVLQEVQQVGTQSHGLLEAECERLQRVLETRL